MKNLSYIITGILFLGLVSCHNHNHEGHDHKGHNHEEHDHKTEVAIPEQVAEGHDHGEGFIELCQEEAAKAGITTAKAETRKFFSTIPATGQIMPMQGDVATVTAKNDGFVAFGAKNIVSGVKVSTGETLAVITGEGMAQNSYLEIVEQAKIEYSTVKSNYERTALLKESGLASVKDFQESEAAYKLAELKYNNLKNDFEGNGLKVKSPVQGYVNDVYVSQGDYVTTGQPLFTVSKNNTLALYAEVSPEYISRLPKVVSANFRTSAAGKYYSVADMGGKVESYGRSLDSRSMLVPVSFSIPYDSGLAPGAFAEVIIILDEGVNSIVLPKEAIMEDFGHTFVYAGDEHGYERHYVEAGGNNGIEVQILSGIEEGDEVVVTGAARLKLIERLSGASGEAAAHAGHSH